MKVAVKDANVLIDLIEADLLGLWFRLGIETQTTDLVRYEIRQPVQRQRIDAFVDAGSLKIVELSSEELLLVQSESRRLKVSLADASAFALARSLGAALLSGDQVLRKAAAAAGVEVRGVLWVFDRLIEDGLISAPKAATRLRHLMGIGSFLPATDCMARLHRWEEKERS